MKFLPKMEVSLLHILLKYLVLLLQYLLCVNSLKLPCKYMGRLVNNELGKLLYTLGNILCLPFSAGWDFQKHLRACLHLQRYSSTATPLSENTAYADWSSSPIGVSTPIGEVAMLTGEAFPSTQCCLHWGLDQYNYVAQGWGKSKVLSNAVIPT